MKLKKGDNVKIVKGKDKGKTGTIERVYEYEAKVLVAGVNQYKRHQKARALNQKSEIVTITKPLSVSNVGFVCPKCKKMARIGYAFQNDKKVRICKNCEEAL